MIYFILLSETLSCSLFQIGPRALTVSTVVLGALAPPWLVAVAVCLAIAMDTATLFEDTVITRQASVTALTTLRDHTASPVFLVTMEIPGKEIYLA